VAQDKEALKRMVEISGARTVPVITACGEFMIGFDPSRLEQMINCIEHRSEVE
jgi:glutaredoxin